MATGIQIISSTIVKSSNPENGAPKIELTPWDLQFLFTDYIQRGFLFHVSEPNELNEESVLDALNIFKTSLSNTLNHFSPLSGRLATTSHEDDTVSFFIDCNNAGALFVHAAIDEVTTRDINQVGYVPSVVDSFFQLNGVQNCQGTTKPLLAVQVTRLIDGFFLCISLNHAIIDGASFFHFFSYWMGMTKGSSCFSKPPVLERWFLSSTHCPVRIPRSYFKQIDDGNEFVVDSSSNNSPLKVRVFHFNKEVIAKLKEKANEEVIEKKDREISSLQALLSHLWRSIVRNKDINPDEETTYCLLIDARPRLTEEVLPQGYFGNALQVGSVTMKAEELLDKGLGNAALKMNRMIASYGEEKLRDWLESWTKCPKINGASNLSGRNAIVTADSPRFKFYGVESRWGRPIAIRSGPANKCDGKITVRSGVEEGSIDVELILSLETFQAMEKDHE